MTDLNADGIGPWWNWTGGDVPLSETPEFRTWKYNGERDNWQARYSGDVVRRLIEEVERLTFTERAVSRI